MTGDPDTQALAIKSAVQNLVAATAAERGVRISLLAVNGWKCVVAGALILFTGGLPTVDALVGNWSRIALGSLAFLAGLVLLVGTYGPSRPGRIETIMAGLGLVGLWDALMMLAVIWTLGIAGGVAWSMPWQPISTEHPRPYVVALYLALTVMIWGVHGSSVWSLYRARRAAGKR